MTTLDIPIATPIATSPTPSQDSRLRTNSGVDHSLDLSDEAGNRPGSFIDPNSTRRVDAKSIASFRRHFAQECALDESNSPASFHRRLTSDVSAISIGPIEEGSDADSVFEKTDNVTMEDLLAVISCSWDHEGLPRAGRLFVTPVHVCFWAKSLSRIDKFVVPWKDVKALEKKMTAGFVPNGLRIVSSSHRYHLSSVGKRDQVYTKLLDVWTMASGPLQRDPRPLQVGDHHFVQLPRQSSLEDLNTPTTENRIVSPHLLSPTPSPPPGEGEIVPIIQITQPSIQRLPGGFHDGELSGNISISDGILTVTDSIIKRYTTVSGWIPEVLKAKAREAAERVRENGTLERLDSPKTTAPSISSKPETPIEVKPLASSIPSTNLHSHQKSSSTSSVPDSPLSIASDVSSCGCTDHYKHEVMNEVFDGTLEQVFQSWFAEGGSDAFKKTHDKLETMDLRCGNWTLDAQGSYQKRIIEYLSTFKPPMLPKQSTPATETQEIVKKTPSLYIIETETKTPQVPYGSTFVVLNRYCLTMEGSNKIRMRQTSKVDFNPRSMWSDKIEKTTYDGEDKMAGIAIGLMKKSLKPQDTTPATATLRKRALGLADGNVSSDASTDYTPKRRLSRGSLRRKPTNDSESYSWLLIAAVALTIVTTLLNAYWSYQVNRGVLETLTVVGNRPDREKVQKLEQELAELYKRLNQLE